MNQPQRPDQSVEPQQLSVAAGGAAGIFRGRLVIVNGQTPPAGGIFLYDAGGQLVGYWVSIAGTDPIHNSSINPGFQVQNGTTPTEFTNIVPGIIDLEKTSGVTVGPEITMTDATLTAPFGSLTIDTTSGVLMGAWQSLPLAAGWSQAGGQAPAAYRLISGNMVQIVGSLTHAAFTTNIAVTSSSLPAAYRPLSNYGISGDFTGDAGIQVNTAGGVNAELGTLASATICRFNGIYPLDN